MPSHRFTRAGQLNEGKTKMSTPEPSLQRTVGHDGKSYPATRKQKPDAAPEHATDGSALPVNAGGKRDTRFKAGNPGKPKGTRHRATLIAEALIDGSGELLVKKCVEMALGGDAAAMRLVMERLCPPRRERPVSLAMPKINAASDLIGAAAALTDATAAGDITPGEAASLSALVGNVAKAIETVEIVARLERIEEQLGTKGMQIRTR
jgi:hypothetical protein